MSILQEPPVQTSLVFLDDECVCETNPVPEGDGRVSMTIDHRPEERMQIFHVHIVLQPQTQGNM